MVVVSHVWLCVGVFVMMLPTLMLPRVAVYMTSYCDVGYHTVGSCICCTIDGVCRAMVVVVLRIW